MSTPLRAARELRHLTQVQLAEAAGCSQSIISRLESGTAVPRADVAIRIARVLATSVEALFEAPEAPKVAA